MSSRVQVADLMTEWARLDKKQSHLPATGARRIEVLRPFRHLDLPFCRAYF